MNKITRVGVDYLRVVLLLVVVKLARSEKAIAIVVIVMGIIVSKRIERMGGIESWFIDVWVNVTIVALQSVTFVVWFMWIIKYL